MAFRPATSESVQLLRVRLSDTSAGTLFVFGRRAVWAGARALWSARCLLLSTAFSPVTPSAVSGNAHFGARANPGTTTAAPAASLPRRLTSHSAARHSPRVPSAVRRPPSSHLPSPDHLFAGSLRSSLSYVANKNMAMCKSPFTSKKNPAPCTRTATLNGFCGYHKVGRSMSPRLTR